MTVELVHHHLKTQGHMKENYVIFDEEYNQRFRVKGRKAWRKEVHSMYLEGQANTNGHNQHSLQGLLTALWLMETTASCILKCGNPCGKVTVG